MLQYKNKGEKDKQAKHWSGVFLAAVYLLGQFELLCCLGLLQPALPLLQAQRAPS